MKPFLPLVLFALGFSMTTRAQDTTRVLFIGNSYSYFNDMPVMLTDLANSLGHVVETEQNTPGGASLQGHLNNPTTLSLIQQGGWDYVVLQEQSQKASLPEDQVIADFYPSVAGLVEEIRQYNACAVPLLYMTWGRENGDAQNCSWWPPVCTYTGMQELLTDRYLEAADMTESWCVPVGMVWEDLLGESGIDLYNNDGSHPSLQGSYLIASTMTVAMFGSDPGPSAYTGDIDAAEAALIDAAVWTVWQNQPNAWRQYDLMEANLFHIENTLGFNLQLSTSPYVDSVVVSTGSVVFTMTDGAVYSLEASGTTTLDLTVYSACGEPVEMSETLVHSGSTGVSNDETPHIAIFPNPANDQIIVQHDFRDPVTVRLSSLRGDVIQESLHQETKIQFDVNDTPAGSYILEILVGNERVKSANWIIQH